MQVFIARQPILTHKEDVFAYELLYRNCESNCFDSTVDGDVASMELIENLVALGLNNITSKKRAFVNFTSTLLKKSIFELLPSKTLGVEILEDVVPDTDVIASCIKLKEKGYLLALDDFVFRSDYQPLIDLADIIKIDFLTATQADKVAYSRYFSSISNAKLLAEKIETREDFEQAKDLGFTYFQGYYFCKPIIFSGKKLSTSKLFTLQLLTQINDPNISFDKLEAIFKKDTAMSYKLLRLINSPVYGLRSNIYSLRHALTLLGLEEIRKWSSVIAYAKLNEDKPSELMTTSIVRAKFAENLAFKASNNKVKAAQAFLIGMFSLIDACLDQPITNILDQLSLTEQIRNVLIGTDDNSFLSLIYQLVTAYERASWVKLPDLAQKIGLDVREIPALYFSALDFHKHYSLIS